MLLWIFYAVLGFAAIQQFRLGSDLNGKLLFGGGTLVVGTAALIWGVQEMTRGGEDPYFPLLIATVAAHVVYWWRRSKYRVQ